jgi:hypothetical protein
MSWIDMVPDGSTQVFLENFMFGVPGVQRRRPTWIRSRIRIVPNTGRFRSGTTPIALQGNVFALDARPFNNEYGHLVGLSIGGMDVPANLVPMYGGVNRGTYRAIERELELAAVASPNPVVVVGIQYPAMGTGVDDDARVPVAFNFWFFPNLTGPLSAALPMGPAWRQIPNERAGGVRFPIEDGDIERRRFHVELRARTIREGWGIEQLGGDAVAWSRNGWLPPIASRPYGYLDRIAYSPEFEGYAKLMLPRWDMCDIGPGKEFVEAQRVNVVYANCYTQADDKKGECWSDDPHDPVRSVLTHLGSDNGFQIDHIHPKASMGPNIYSNAQVLSSAHNRSKGRS